MITRYPGITRSILDRLTPYSVSPNGPATCPTPGCWRVATVFVRSADGSRLVCRPCALEGK